MSSDENKTIISYLEFCHKKSKDALLKTKLTQKETTVTPPKIKESKLHKLEQKFPQDGSIWHGRWIYNKSGTVFGSETKPNHFAVTPGESGPKNNMINFFPITSSKQRPDQCLLILPPGRLGMGQKDKSSYILKFRIPIERNDLRRRFSEKGLLKDSDLSRLRANMSATTFWSDYKG